MANKKMDIANVSLTFQALTKSTGKELDQVHALEFFIGETYMCHLCYQPLGL
jgi:hypothetical protein